MRRSNNAWEAVEDVLTAHQAIPESDSSLEALLPAITACFGASLSATDTIKALKEHQCSDDFSGKSSIFSGYDLA